ncbi:hypothetical protein [Cytobacillus horneckiae]|uniref:hypothetical protein n=1 Tax=Cytobacillus horneckiae TaxID=549687 RepID=UPI003D9A92C2
MAAKPKRNTVVTRIEKAKIVKAKGSPKGGSSTAGKSSSSAKKSSSLNKQIMEDSVDDAVGDKVTDKAKILEMNKLSGAAAEKLAAEDLVSQGNIILGSQVSVRTSAGIRRIAHLIMDPAGNLKAVEVKAGNARRNASQLRKDFLLETEGGVIIGKNAPRDLVGQFRKIPTIEMRY